MGHTGHTGTARAHEVQIPAGGRQERGRAIGVIYRPETERQSHYFHARLPAQFDAGLHFGETRAVEPLERTARWQSGETEEAAETFTSGL